MMPGHDAWAQLAAHVRDPNPFYAPALLQPALRHLDGEGAVRLLCAGPADAPVALLPVARARRHGRMPIACTVNWMHAHCFYGAPLLAPGREEEGWATLLDLLDRDPMSGHLLHLRGMDADGRAGEALRAVCRREGRALQPIQFHERAMLRSGLTGADYWQVAVRGKKRKEIGRLERRLSEEGRIETRIFGPGENLAAWTDAFLALETAGWKGRNGTALACAPDHAAFFREIVEAAARAGMLDMLRIDKDGAPIAMLVNFMSAGGGFSFKIAHDEALARYSPGVLIEKANLARVLDDERAEWMDSCAAPDHPMIDSLWAERRRIVQYRVALRGAGRRVAFAMAGVAERMMAGLKGRS